MDKENFYKKTWVVVLGTFVACFLWGSAFPSIKLGYRFFNIESSDTATQILFAGIRFFIAGILAIIITSIASKKFLYPSIKALPKVGLLSIFQTIAQYIFFYVGLAHTTGVKSSIIEASNVFIAMIISSLIFHQEKLRIKKIIGCIIGFLGVVIVNLNGLSFEFNFLGDGFILLSTLAYAFSTVVMKKFSKDENPMMLSAYQFVLGGLIMIIIGLCMGGRLVEINYKGVLILIYLAFVSAIAYSIWSLLLKYNDVSRVTVYGFMNPMFGVILSAILLKEGTIFDWKYLVALVLVCLGIFAVNFEKKNKQEDKINS